MTLRIRWLGRVGYRDALALQHALHRVGPGGDDWLLLLEHPHVYTLGVSADPEHVLVDPASVGAELVRADRGGDVTYHGPGQLTGYPILSVPTGPAAIPAYVHGVEQLIIDVLADLGLSGAGRLAGYPGVWVGLPPAGAEAGRPTAGAEAGSGGEEPRKICAIGVRLTRGRSMHGFALNVDPDIGMFGHIVPCGIADKAVTSLAAEGVAVTMAEVVDAVARRAAERWAADPSAVERQDVAWRVRPEDQARFTRGIVAGSEGSDADGSLTSRRPAEDRPVEATPAEPVGGRPGGSAPAVRPPGRPGGAQPVRLLGRLAEAGVDPSGGLALAARKPAWLRVRADMGPGYRDLKRTMRSLDLVTVCEEAGCPNIFECWADGTATFMINGDRCTRACGFCLVDTSKPRPVDPDEPERVAEAVARMGLSHAVVTAVARDDLPDGGAAGFAATISAIHQRRPGTAVEVLIPDCRGVPEALDAIFAARPEILNHNLETVARLQRAVRPSASYARSLAVLARARAAGLTTKSGMILGMGETEPEVRGGLADLHGVGVGIVTLGQYLRPTARHLPVARWWTPEEFTRLKAAGEALGIPHVEASPLTRSSYHARQAAASARPTAAVPVATGAASGSAPTGAASVSAQGSFT